MNNDKSADARYIRINGNYYAKAKIDFYETHPFTDAQLAILQAEETNLRRAFQSGSCSRPSLKALELMGALFNRRVNAGCQRCIVSIVSETAEMFFYFRDKAVEEANAKTFVEQTKAAEKTKPATTAKSATAKAKKPSPKKK